MASFTGVGDNVELAVTDRDENVTVSLSGTYNMTIVFQRELGSPGSGAWETIKTYTTANATVSDVFITDKYNTKYRLYVTVDNSGTCTATLTDSFKSLKTEKDSVGNTTVEYTQGGVKFPGSIKAGVPVLITAATTLTADEHGGRFIVFNDADGATVTLPAATGSGVVFEFFVAVTVTSVSDKIQVANADDTMAGVALIANDAADTLSAWETAATSDTITLNGTTTGGILGDYVKVVDVKANKWFVSVIGSATGTEATPFSAAV